MPHTLKQAFTNYRKLNAFLGILFVVLSAITVNTSWQYYVEGMVRQDARHTLEKVRSCVDDYPADNIVDKLAFCAKGVTTTPTGDMFAYNLKTKAFVFDPSMDCHVEGGKTMTVGSICTIFNDPSSCAAALTLLNSGIDSYAALNAEWLFDESEEYLEWIVYPNKDVGINGIARLGVQVPEQIIIAIGIQKDELYEMFKPFDIILKSVFFLAILLTLISASLPRQAD